MRALLAPSVLLALCLLGSTVVDAHSVNVQVFLGAEKCAGQPKVEKQLEEGKCVSVSLPSPFGPPGTEMPASGYISCKNHTSCDGWTGKVWLGMTCGKTAGSADAPPLIDGSGKDAFTCTSQQVYGFDVSLKVACGGNWPATCTTQAPTQAPTKAPTAAPTNAPTKAPTGAPTAAPTSQPTAAPTPAPTPKPKAECSEDPHCSQCDVDGKCVKCFRPYSLTGGRCLQPPPDTNAPTASPTAHPTASPTAAPTPVVVATQAPVVITKPPHKPLENTHISMKPSQTQTHSHTAQVTAHVDDFGCPGTHKDLWCPCTGHAECVSGKCEQGECKAKVGAHDPEKMTHWKGVHKELCQVLKEYGMQGKDAVLYGC